MALFVCQHQVCLQSEIARYSGYFILDKPNGDHGSTVLYGYRYAIKNHADYIFQTDSDGQTNLGKFEQF